jgi:hypothetical protein
MLDAFIIERIRQEREQRDSGLRPARIHVPRPEDDPRWHEERERDEHRRRQEDRDPPSDRGVVIIDYNI